MLLTLAALAALAPQGPGPSLSPVCINEFSYDDDGTDDLEFVELVNRAGVAVDISGWVLQGEEGDATGSPNGSFTFPGTPGSMTTVINPGQYIVVGLPAVPNVNFSLPTTVMENGGGTTTPGSDGLTLRDDLGNVIDSVVWEYAGWTNPVPPWLEGDGLQGGYLLNATNAALISGSMQRWLDGYDSDSNGADFVMMQWTPGAPNGSLNVAVPPIVENFDGAVGSTVSGTFLTSFVLPTVRDPASIVTSGTGTWSVPPSPQGGNCASLHDTTGGGNSHITRTIISTDYLVECYVLIPGGNAAISATEGEAWAIGVGTTGSYGHPLDVAGNYYPGLLCNVGNGPGAVGIAWIAYNRQGQTDLYLVDIGDGGPGFTVLAGPITATPGVNDGWQRLRLRVSNTSVQANFGGTFGVNDGQTFTATVSPRLYGQVYLEYRECILTNANMRPLVIDRLEIYPTVDSSVTFAGVGSPTTIAQPIIGTAGGLPSVGNAAFQIVGSGMIPGGVSLMVLDGAPLLPGIPVPGAPPTLLVYAAPSFVGTVFNSIGGTATFNFPLPPTTSLIGSIASGQWFDLDPGLGVPLPFGSSGGMQLLVGND